jgi:hypothetical protein
MLIPFCDVSMTGKAEPMDDACNTTAIHDPLHARLSQQIGNKRQVHSNG